MQSAFSFDKSNNANDLPQRAARRWKRSRFRWTDFLMVKRYCAHIRYFSRRCNGRNNRTEGYVLGHRNGSGNKLEGARGCLSGIRSSRRVRRDTKGRPAKRNCIDQPGLRQRTDFTWTFVFKRYPSYVRFLRTIKPTAAPSSHFHLI